MYLSSLNLSDPCPLSSKWILSYSSASEALTLVMISVLPVSSLTTSITTGCKISYIFFKYFRVCFIYSYFVNKCILILKVPSKICSRRHSKFFYLVQFLALFTKFSEGIPSFLEVNGNGIDALENSMTTWRCGRR